MAIIFTLGQLYPTDSLLMTPGDWSTAIGIITSSLVHQSIDHLVYNSAALFIFYFFLIKENQLTRPIFDTAILIVVSNLLIFLIGNPAYSYLGSSNLVYALFGYSLAAIVFERKLLLLIPIAILAGILIAGLVISTNTVSYLSHYMGVLTGFSYCYFRYLKQLRIYHYAK